MPKPRSYNPNDIEIALNEINDGLSIHAAARKFKIPRPTLQNRIHNRAKKASYGPSPILTADEEQKIVLWLLANHAKGFPRRKQDVQNVVKDFLDAATRENPFKNNMPGNKWYENFLKRHPNLTVRTPEPITDASSKVAESNIRGWFEQIKKYLTEKDYFKIVEDPSRVFNGDETNFLMCPKSGKVLAPKGTKNVYETDRGQAKENLTVMFSFSASGFVVPPLIIYPYKRVPTDVISSIPDGLKWLKSDSGWMTTDVFHQYIKDIFHPSLVAENVKFPIVLYVDGHRTHLTYELSKLCEGLKIILICLYPNSTRILQPADVSIFKPLKTGWQKAVLNWRKKNIDKKLTKCCFAPILKDVVDQCINKNTIINGFRTCGLQPFNPDAIDYSKCLGRNSSNIIQNKQVGFDENNSLEKTMNLNKFKDLVGPEKLKQLDNLAESPDTQNGFAILLQIYHSFLTNTDQKIEDDNTIIFNHDGADETDHGADETDASKPTGIMDAGNVCSDYEFNCETIELDEVISQEVESIEFIDEFEGTENLNLSGIPIIHIDAPNVQITSFLAVPETPVRMGIRNSDHRSFIISSTPFQKAEEDKINKKRLAEVEKENRCKERQIKKEKKIQEALFKQQCKKEKLENKLNSKSKQIKKRATNKPVVKYGVTPGNKNNQVTTKFSSPRRTTLEINSAEGDAPHVRQLFSNDEEVDVHINNNSKTSNGICFQCAGHITASKMGVTCKLCKYRTYHEECAKKITNDIEDFHCQCCSIK